MNIHYQLSLITGDDFETVEELLRFTKANKEYCIKRAKRCERNMKRDFDL